MRIGELAERTGASRRSIRYYEQQGLLSATRTSNGWREYDEKAVNRVSNVRELIRAGLTVEDIQHVVACLDKKTEDFMSCDDPGDALSMYEARLADVDEKAAELQRQRSELSAKIARLRSGARSTEEFVESLSSSA
ncbi:DNA-binding transcriptional MerR regulator [Actinopolyspora biskrensis]|uniref:DNA-binding transcriptional MerR regulator n=1 Tax=Actinopolyspora biskrensis TaxID=1470178 RepID=A0A852YYL3_9ACTN|nr:MerR family transcriptional regulator [Actinopolyspora biskrensis]NYH79258.1 DNA-binding transcriptional MerR regulator [Actinopolyspora biskrensis]